MDDRTWYLAIGTLGASIFAVFLDAILASFNVPGGFWGVLSGVLALLAGRSVFKARQEER